VLIKLGERAYGGVGPDGDIVAYSSLCTHMDCPVSYSKKRFLCACHYSLFDPIPIPPKDAQSITETMHNVVKGEDGKLYNILIVPAMDSPINRGNYSIRGGTNAQAAYSPTKPTRDRLLYPMVRVGDQFMPVSWDEAIDLIARVVKGVKDKWGPDSIAMKIHDHGNAGAGFEDN
jgi:hypothetical protein